ncbi:PhzF family phenazine biosynthesis protein [Fulvivirga sp. RKSG066]|uniref:PhzF family phenazine biosynthesis protein n=1 Tax=Fulvivirga aurantia TaxID=2529383 RepID=UPI0012BB8BEA|nr:PhzF family phenazine biosynthesis protein [Fulvivirga aurantia]MTI22983.1 PhzF family phenazine biosynthesis protein [Fulvivirga aurantia]
MKTPIYQVDAFTSELFGGNPAAVCPLKKWLSDDLMQNIAGENNLSETAFFVKTDDGFHLRWFTPNTEVDLCGHATLATAHVIFNHLGYDQDEIQFESKSGLLTVSKQSGKMTLNFPADNLKQIEITDAIIEGLGIRPKKGFNGVSDMLFIVESESEVRALHPDFGVLGALDRRGIIVSAPGDDVDFVSRCFYPACGIDEDPVTGSAHTTMVPYWAKTLGKTDLKAQQLSQRGGQIDCKLESDRVLLTGAAVTYLEGQISIPDS